VFLFIIVFYFSFCLDTKRNKKIKANLNASGHFASQRHGTSLLFIKPAHTAYRFPESFTNSIPFDACKCGSLIIWERSKWKNTGKKISFFK